MDRSRSSFGTVMRRPRFLKRDGVTVRAGFYPGYYVRVQVHGREVLRWAGSDRKTATEFLANVFRKTTREDLFGEKAVAAVTFEEAKPALLAYRVSQHGAETVRADQGRFDRIVRHFGTRFLRDVTTAEVQDFLTTLRTEGLSVATVNRYASALSVAFRAAVEKGYAITNPTEGLPKRGREDKRAVPFLSTGDVDRIVAEAREPAFAAYLRVLADTGLRLSEAVRLEWRDVDLRRKVLVVRTSKIHQPRDIPLTKRARAAFESIRDARGPLPVAGSEPVWPAYRALSKSALSRRFARAAVRAGFEGLGGIHALRHVFCSQNAQAGTPLPTIAALAGHKSIATTMRYAAHLPEGATRDAIRRLERAGERRPRKTPKRRNQRVERIAGRIVADAVVAAPAVLAG